MDFYRGVSLRASWLELASSAEKRRMGIDPRSSGCSSPFSSYSCTRAPAPFTFPVNSPSAHYHCLRTSIMREPTDERGGGASARVGQLSEGVAIQRQ